MKSITTLVLGLVVVWSQAARAEVEQGAAENTPWSGYWWPISKGEIIAGPLTKYDALTGHSAARWEYGRNPPGPNVPQWHGYCHAWSAAALLEGEPKQVHPASGSTGRQLQLGVGDQKGMLTSAHAADIANTVGDRYGDGQGSEDPYDIAPDMLWQVLRQYIRDQRVAVVMDLEAGSEVWNYPVYAYRIEYSGGNGPQSAMLSLWAADDAVPPDHVGTKIHYQTYTFTCQMQNGNVVMGSGRWTGNSVRNHPDFVWYPYVVRPQNPEVEHAAVKQLVGDNPPDSTTPPTDPTNPPTDPGTPPVDPNTPVNPPNQPPDLPPGTPPGIPPGTPPGMIPGGGPGGTVVVDPFGGQGTQGAVPISPIQVIAAVAQKTSAFDFDITVNRFDGGHYAVGENFTVSGSSARPGFLYLFYINSAGNLWLIYPMPGQHNYIAANQRFELPGANDPYVFQTMLPAGTARVKGLVTGRPLLLSGLAMQEQSTLQKGLRRVARRDFRWVPSQQAQMKDLLTQYNQKQELAPPQLDGVDPSRFLGPFAQDEVAFYVGPRGLTPAGARGNYLQSPPWAAT